jgi:uracil permease
MRLFLGGFMEEKIKNESGLDPAMESQTPNNGIVILGPRDRPKSIGKWITLSFQHVFAMFGATVLVPIVINQMANQQVFNISMALFCCGVGTLIYIALTGAKVPIYLGSSFSYMTVIGLGYADWGNAIFIAIFCIGIVYVLMGFIIYWTGITWVKKVFSPIVIGPIITVIGLSAIPSALKNIGLITDPSMTTNWITTNSDGTSYPQWLAIIIGAVTFLVAAIVMLKAKSFAKAIPILIALAVGYVLTLIIHFALSGTDYSLLNTKLITDVKNWEWYPNFSAFWKVKGSSVGPAIVSIVPIAIVTMIEHLGDHINVGVMSNRDYIKDPGIHKTLMADGVSLMFDGLVGGPANTTYAENTSVVGITKVASVWVTGLAAIFAICMSFIAPINQIVQMIPTPVLGGISFMLFGMISINGIKLLVDNKVDLLNARNMVICASVLISGAGIGIHDAVVSTPALVVNGFQFTGLFVAAILGISMNLVLPQQDNAGILSMFSWMKSKNKVKKKNN